MEYVSKFLGLDSDSIPSNSQLPLDSFSYTIRHKYPEPLITYDAEERNEPRLMRRSDLTESQLNIMQQSKNILRRPRKISMNINRFMPLEQCGKALHALSVERMSAGAEQTDDNSTTNWDGLNPMKKFGFYWQALTGHKLRSTPYANFKRIFMRLYHKDHPDECERRLRMLARRNWLCLSKKERVPFNMQALLYHISTGDVDPYDHCAIRVLLNRWR